MDKNKAAFKLQNIPHIYWINLDEDEQRRIYMEAQFKYWEIKNHTRIEGYDARGDNDVSCFLKGIIPDGITQCELGCCMSHLKAIKHFYQNTTDDYCIIVEDDVSLDTVRYWNFTWMDFFKLIPYDWDCVQLTTIPTGDIHVKIHLKFINDFSAAIYLISRHHAAKLMKHHIRGDKYKLDNGVLPRATSEDTIFESGKTYSVPLFLYNINFPSTIHAEHIHVFHQGPYNALSNYWQNVGSDMSINDRMRFDPYHNRITENSNNQPQPQP